MDAYTDKYCADGVISDGWRLVRPDGRVKFGGEWWQHEKLKPYVGQTVHVHFGDYWQQFVNIYDHVVSSHNDFICQIGKA